MGYCNSVSLTFFPSLRQIRTTTVQGAPQIVIDGSPQSRMWADGPVVYETTFTTNPRVAGKAGKLVELINEKKYLSSLMEENSEHAI